MRVKKVLLVDDSPTDQLVVIRILASQNFDIVTASSGEEAIEKVGLEMPEIVLMDITLDGKMDGIKAASEIK